MMIFIIIENKAENLIPVKVFSISFDFFRQLTEERYKDFSAFLYCRTHVLYQVDKVPIEIEFVEVNDR